MESYDTGTDMQDEVKSTDEEMHKARFTEQDGDDLSFALEDLSISVGSTAMKTFSIGAEIADQKLNVECNVAHAGVATNIHYFQDAENTMGGRTGYVAIKSALNEMCSDDSHVSRLRNEYTMSQHLISRCTSIRAALRQTDFDGHPALALEWVPGTTLRSWIHLLHKKRSLSLTGNSGVFFIIEDMKVTLQLACILSKALADIHAAGVTHNNLTTDNIIVDDTDGSPSACMLVKVIGLGSASLVTDVSQAPSEIRRDIVSLGSILFEMFTGRCPFEGGSDWDSCFSSSGHESKTMLSHNQLISTLLDLTPKEVARFILDLMEANGSITSYKSANDAERELSRLLSNLESIISTYEPYKGLGRLQIHQGKLYGRDSHLSTLMDAWNRIGTPDASKMVLISGYSGVGKSAVVEYVKAKLKQKKVHFISGKFDQHQQAGPLSAVDAAVTAFTNNIIHQGHQTILETKRAILDAINTDIGVLTGAFPCLCKIIGKPTTAPTNVGSMEAQNRFKFIFQMFVRAVDTPSYPIILHLDDLQWADKLSLQLISSLVTDAEINNFLFIGTYRENEIDATHPLAVQLDDLKRREVAVVNISLGRISKEEVNDMISDIISIPLPATKSLSDIVYKKTSGNPLFVTQLLWSLWDEGLLFYSLDFNAWQWNEDAIEAKEILDDVGALMSQGILQLPVGCQLAIKLLACIGFKCDETILKMFMGQVKDLQGGMNAHNATSDEWISMLDLAVNEGLLKKGESSYAFVHDQIQHAAYSLIPENDQGRLHKEIGELILKHMTDDNYYDLLFTVVDQLNRGQQNIEDEIQKVRLVVLNLKAGEKAKSIGTFLNSASYLKAGISLLCDGHWEICYDLSLQLYSLYAEAEYCNGHFQEVGQAVGIAIKQAKSFDDKLRVYGTLIKSLAAQNKLQQAIDIGFNVLMELGVECPFPPPDETVVVRDIMKAKQILEEITEPAFLSFQEMKDGKMIEAMKFLKMLLLYTFLGKQQYLPIIINQMIQLTLRHGICKESCVALSFFSYLLCGVEDFKASGHIGHLAILLLEKFKAEEYLSQVYMSYVSGIICWTGNIKLSLEKQLHGYQVGMQTGDIESAMFNAHFYLLNSYISGRSLVELERELDLFGKQMIEYKQDVAAQFILRMRQLVTKLMTSSLMVGEDKNQEDLLALAMKKEENIAMVAFLYILSGLEAYIFGNYELAVEIVRMRQQVEKRMSRTILIYGGTDFIDGLIFLAMAHKTNDVQYNSGISKATSKLENFVQIGKANCEHKLLLLQAEKHSLLGQKDDALNKYELAIAAAERNDFIHEHAIAHERAGDFFQRNNDGRALQHYGKAHALYAQWGAQGKADHLANNLPF